MTTSRNLPAKALNPREVRAFAHGAIAGFAANQPGITYEIAKEAVDAAVATGRKGAESGFESALEMAKLESEVKLGIAELDAELGDNPIIRLIDQLGIEKTLYFNEPIAL